jgi:hypothetical protein
VNTRQTWVPESSSPVISSRANVARVHNYLLGGKDHLAADRALAHRMLELAPNASAVLWANREFVGRAAGHLAARRGVRQFVMVGTGFPGQQNVHDVVQGIDPKARVLYVANDPVVLTHARALLVNNDRVGVVEGDPREPDGFLRDPEAHELIDFTCPVAVLMAGDLHFVTSERDPYEVVARIRDAIAPAGYLVLSHAVARPETILLADMVEEYADEPFSARTKEQIAAFFTGLVLEPPGLVSVSRWSPGTVSVPDDDVWLYAGVGRTG